MFAFMMKRIIIKGVVTGVIQSPQGLFVEIEGDMTECIKNMQRC